MFEYNEIEVHYNPVDGNYKLLIISTRDSVTEIIRVNDLEEVFQAISKFVNKKIRFVRND